MSTPAPFAPIAELLERSLSIRHVDGEPVRSTVPQLVIPVAKVMYWLRRRRRPTSRSQSKRWIRREDPQAREDRRTHRVGVVRRVWIHLRVRSRLVLKGPALQIFIDWLRSVLRRFGQWLATRSIEDPTNPSSGWRCCHLRLPASGQQPLISAPSHVRQNGSATRASRKRSTASRSASPR